MTNATIILGPDGTAEEATPQALALLGVTLDRLRELPPGAFSATPPDPESDNAFREEWERAGSPDIGGEATIQRLDGEKVRVKFAIAMLDDGRYRAVLERATGATESPPRVYAAGQVLAEWRAAERQLSELHPGHPDYDRVQADIESFRTRYQELFRR
jgi:hypothetical protein